ncbi:hypothetical protein HOY82DRAFT_183276 [Tuber indicum]|nr:hypothetical protein HOY82DRAFT_183276 [Tuber indicum]
MVDNYHTGGSLVLWMCLGGLRGVSFDESYLVWGAKVSGHSLGPGFFFFRGILKGLIILVLSDSG